jgi:hypothetical protein
MLVRAFADAATDDGKVFFLVGAGGVGINKGGLAGAQLTVTDDAGLDGAHGFLSNLNAVWVETD